MDALEVYLDVELVLESRRVFLGVSALIDIVGLDCLSVPADHGVDLLD